MNQHWGTRLGDIAEFLRGLTYKPTDVLQASDVGAMPCMRTKNIQQFLEDDDLVYIPDRLVKADRRLAEGDILVSSANSWNLVGKCCWVPDLGYEATFGGFTSVLRADRRLVDPRYLYHWFSWEKTQTVVRSLGQQTTNISNLNQNRCLELALSLPPLDEQRRIAAILDKADAMRQKRKRAIALLDALTESVFKTATINPVVVTAPLSDALTFVTSGGRNWTQYTAEEGVRFIRSFDVQNGWISHEDAIFVAAPDNAEAKRTRTQVGDVLLTITGSRIGRASALPGYLSGAYVSQHVAILRVNQQKLLPEFLSAFLISDQGQAQIAKWQYGQTKPGLNFEQIRRFEIPMLPLASQERFVKQSEALAGRMSSLEKGVAMSDVLFASLQHRAFSGQL